MTGETQIVGAASVQLAAPARVINRCREIKRMGSVPRNTACPQIRCCPAQGGYPLAPFQYEVNVQGRWVSINYQFAQWVVDNQRLLAGRTSWMSAYSNSNATTGISTGDSSTLSDTTEEMSGSYSSETAMSTNVYSLFGISKQSSRG